MNDRHQIALAFKELRKLGWFARMRWKCCQGCGCEAVPDAVNNKYVFYHKQDAEAFNKEGNIGNHARWEKNQRKDLYLTHGEGGDGHEICAVLNKHGLKVDWDGNNDRRIKVEHKA